MPTGAKLAAGLLYFGIAYVAAIQAQLTFQEGTPAAYFKITVAIIGFWQGWMVMGNRAGAGFSTGMSNGLRTSVQIAFFALAVFALREMFMRSVGGTYGANPADALTGAMELFLEYFMQTLTIQVWVVLLVGGIIGGILTEIAAKMWR